MSAASMSWRQRSQEPTEAPLAPDRNALFISYSRRDAGEVDAIVAQLEQNGMNVWIDRKDIPLTADFLLEIEQAIARAHAVVFMLSPESVASRMCAGELDTAKRLGKRVIPVQITQLPSSSSAPDAVASSNWIPHQLSDPRSTAIAIRDAMTFDQDYVHMHTWLILLAREWTAGGRRPANVLRGRPLRRAVEWLKSAATHQPAATEAQRAFIQASLRQRNKIRLFRAAVTLTIVGAGAVSSRLVYDAQLEREADALQTRARQVVAMLDGPRQRDALVQMSDISNQWTRQFGVFTAGIRGALVHTLARAREVDAWKTETAQVVALAVQPISGEIVAALRTATDGGDQNIAAVWNTATHARRLLAATLAPGERVNLCPRGSCVVVHEDERPRQVLGLSGNALARTRLLDRYRVTAVDASANGDRLFMGTESGQVWRVGPGSRITAVASFDSPVSFVSLSPDEAHLLVVLQSRVVIEQDLITRAAAHYPDLRLSRERPFAYIDGGIVLAARGPGEIVRYRRGQTGELIAQAGNQRLAQIRATPAGRLISATSETEGMAFVLGADGSMKFNGGVFAGINPRIAFSKDERYLYAAGYLDQLIRTLDLEDDPVRLASFQRPVAVWRLGFCDEFRLAWGDDSGRLGIFDVRSREAPIDWASGNERVVRLACRAGVILAVDHGGVARAYDARNGSRRGEWSALGHIADVAHLTSEGFLAAAGRAVYRVPWAGAPQKLFEVEFSDSFRIAIDSERDRIAIASSGAGYVEIRKLSNYSIVVPAFRAHTGLVMELGFRPWNGSLVSAGTLGGSELTPLSTWSPSGQKLQGVNAHPTLTTAIAFLNREQLTFSGGSDGKIRAWDEFLVKSGPDLFSHTDLATSITASPTGLIATSGGDGMIVVHDLTDATLTRAIQRRISR